MTLNASASSNVASATALGNEWICLKDVQRVFGDVNLRLSDLHMVLFMKLVVVFATKCQQGALSVSSSIMNELLTNNTNDKENIKSKKGVNGAVVPKVIMNKDSVQHINIFWLSKYLSYARITKRGQSHDGAIAMNRRSTGHLRK